jgi:uncharacterized protein
MKNQSSTGPDNKPAHPEEKPPMNTLATAARPWYRETWPWLLMLGPAVVVVAGFITLWLAITSFDGMVADDYYKKGLGVNQDLSRRERAATLGITARLEHDAPARKLRASLTGDGPRTLNLRFTHPTRAGQDVKIELVQTAKGQYEGTLLLPAQSKWNIELYSADWAIDGEWSDTATAAIELKPKGGAKP